MIAHRTSKLRLATLAAVLVSVAGCATTTAGAGWTFAAPPSPAPTAIAAVNGGGTGTAGGAPASTSMPGMAGMGSPAPAATQAPAAATAPVADPSAPPIQVYDPIAPAVLSGTVHDIDMPMVDKLMTVAPGHVVNTWTFGGTVPGPTIRVHLGDTIRFHLRNDTQMSHSIDFHASETAMNRQMVEIAPGATWTYTFTANYAGVWMYHCGTVPALHHIANGMFGMVIVEPKGGFEPVDKELAFVQSEWYLGAQGQPVDYAKANAAAPAPDYQVFNGVADQYKDNPIQINTGKRVRIFVLNVGPNVGTSFHIVGTIFDEVIREGVVLARGNAGNWGSQAVDLSPAQGAVVEFKTAEDGMYVMVNHAFNFVGRGAAGILQSGDGDPNN